MASFEDDSDLDDDGDTLKINASFAASYDLYREKEELQKLKDKYGDAAADDLSSSESSSSSEDEGDNWTESVQSDWLRTLAAIKARDPKIYKKEVDFFSTGHEKASSKSKSEKPMFLKDYERKVLLERDGIVDDDTALVSTNIRSGLSYHEEQHRLKKNLLKAAGDDNSDEFLRKRVKTDAEIEAEDADYVKWLKGQSEFIDEETKSELEPLRQIWAKDDLDENSKFLRDFVLGTSGAPADEQDIPTYDEVVGSDIDISEDEQEVQAQEDFERKYNFRFEEPQSEVVKNYPRVVGDSLRREEHKRVWKREKAKQRKAREDAMRREDLKQLKNLKKRELMRQIDRVRTVAGDDELDFSEGDFNADFDPLAHEKMMSRIFGDDYYRDEGKDLEKPKFEFDRYIDDDEAPNDDEDMVDDEVEEEEETDQSEQVPSKEDIEKSLKAYYDLDCDEIVGDVKCRFKYREVAPNDFGLTTDEVLMAKDKELNAWVSLKKMSQHRSDFEEERDRRAYKKRQTKKMRLIPSLSGEHLATGEGEVKLEPQSKDHQEETATAGSKKKRKRRKKKKSIIKSELVEANDDVKIKKEVLDVDVKREANAEGEFTGPIEDKLPRSLKKKKRKRKQKVPESGLPLIVKSELFESEKTVESTENTKPNLKTKGTDKKSKELKRNSRHKKRKLGISDERLKAYGMDPKKVKFSKNKRGIS